MRNLKKNKKGFTLIEIIVVLVIVGIMIAIAVPAVLGYVDKAKESQAMNEGRAGYLAAQTIMITEKTKTATPTDEVLSAALNSVDRMKDAMGVDSTAIKKFSCTVSSGELEGCSFVTKSSDGKTNQYVNIQPNKETAVSSTAKFGTPIELK